MTTVSGCFCFNLRTGGLILASFHAITNTAEILISSISDDLDGHALMEMWSLFVFIQLMIGLLVYGIVKNKAVCMIPGLILTAVAIFVWFESMYLKFIFMAALLYTSEIVYAILFVRIVLIFAAGVLRIYFWSVLFSLYKSIKAEYSNKPTVPYYTMA